MLLEIVQSMPTIPEPLIIEENQSILLIISLILGSISSLAVIVTAIFAYLQWKKAKFESKVAIVANLREKLFDDKNVRESLYKVDYGEYWYTPKFHEEKEPQMSFDKLLSIFEYVCYLQNKKVIGKDESDLIRYSLEKVLRNEQVQAYLFNLYHYSERLGTNCSFANIIQYALENKYWDEQFKDKDWDKFTYFRYLNF